MKLMKKVFGIMAALVMTVPALQAQKVETLELQGAVGKLHAELERPAETAAAAPLVILCHGFADSCNSPLLKQIAKDLYDNGIASLRFDFNAHGKSEGEFRNMTVPNEIEDLKEVVRWAQSQPWVSSVSLLGHSQGGVVVSMTAGELGDSIISNVVLMAPAAVLRDDALRGNTMGAMYDPWNMTADYVVIPWNGLQLGRDYIRSAVTLPIYETARNYQGPVLILHGTHDRVVPYTYGERYHYDYPHSTLKLLPGEDHGFSQNPAEAARMASDWLISQLRK